MTETEKHIYPEKKARDLKDTEKAQIRALIEKGGLNTYEIAKQIGCSSSQVAAIKANMKR